MGILNLKIERTFEVPLWDATMQQKAVDYWSRRGMVFNSIALYELIGKRGNIFGNFISFDMSKLMATLEIRVSSQNEVHGVLIINTVMQQVTEYNRTYWELEMDTFVSFLRDNDLQETKWERFSKGARKAAWSWGLTGGAAGNTMKPEDKP